MRLYVSGINLIYEIKCTRVNILAYAKKWDSDKAQRRGRMDIIRTSRVGTKVGKPETSVWNEKAGYPIRPKCSAKLGRFGALRTHMTSVQGQVRLPEYSKGVGIWYPKIELEIFHMSHVHCSSENFPLFRRDRKRPISDGLLHVVLVPSFEFCIRRARLRKMRLPPPSNFPAFALLSCQLYHYACHYAGMINFMSCCRILL